MPVQRRNIFKVSKILREMLLQNSSIVKKWIVCGIIQLIGTFFYLYRLDQTFAKEYGLSICKADFFVWMDELTGKLLIVIPVALLLFMEISKHMEYEQFLIRKPGRTYLWYETTFRTAVFAAVLTVYNLISVMLYSITNRVSLINWTEKRSMFWYMTQGNVLLDGIVTYAQVLVRFLISTFITYLFTGVMVTLLRLLFNSYIIGWLLCLGIIIIDSYAVKIPLYYGRITIGHSTWLQNWVIQVIPFGIVVILALIVIGQLAIRRKDFYGKT